MGAPTEKSPQIEKPAKDAPPPEDEADAYTTLNLGVWRVLLPNEIVSGGVLSATKHKWNAIVLAYPVVLRFFQEIYHLNPQLFIMLILLKLWGEAESVVMLYVSGRLLRIVSIVHYSYVFGVLIGKQIEVGLTEKRPDVSAISQALGARLLCVTFTALAKWARFVSSLLLRPRLICPQRIYYPCI